MSETQRSMLRSLPEAQRTMASTLPEGVPSLPWPYDNKGYRLTSGGKRYRRLAWVDPTPAQSMSVICFVEPTPQGPVYWCADGWKRPRRIYKTGEWERYAPLYEAALAYEQGTGPATVCAPCEVPVDEQGRSLRGVLDVDVVPI